MSKAYVYDPRKTRLRRVRYAPKNDGLDWQRELYSVFCCTLVPPEAYRPEWKEIHEKKIGLPGVGAL
ncbi:hypothetical protein FH581_003675 [Leptospira weilii]|uniref:hypothetical protein n=1 Tax=Leptospira weilii TaxID=28184 RepID=UPI00201B5221|nr:hypothetical protein [Leptospira weilii]UPY77980.1 hypothetical protein FH581_003675 [Leptospira weilii]